MCTAPLEVQPIINLVEIAPNYSIVSVIWYTTSKKDKNLRRLNGRRANANFLNNDLQDVGTQCQLMKLSGAMLYQ